MNANSNQRPTADELQSTLNDVYNSIKGRNDYQEEELMGYKGKEIKAIFEEADKEIPNISTSYEKDPDAIYTSRAFTFKNLSNPVNSTFITSYLEEEYKGANLLQSSMSVIHNHALKLIPTFNRLS